MNVAVANPNRPRIEGAAIGCSSARETTQGDRRARWQAGVPDPVRVGRARRQAGPVATSRSIGWAARRASPVRYADSLVFRRNTVPTREVIDGHRTLPVRRRLL